VVGAATVRVAGGEAVHLAHDTELLLVGLAVLVAVAGIAFALVRLKPARLTTKAAAPEPVGIERVLEHKYYVDELYDDVVVQPTVEGSRKLLWRGIDVGLIDGVMVNGSALLARAVGWLGSQLQSGQVGRYAWAIVLGVLAILGTFTLR
jgi:NADH-quinone oxidoreductase subunit L